MTFRIQLVSGRARVDVATAVGVLPVAGHLGWAWALRVRVAAGRAALAGGRTALRAGRRCLRAEPGGCAGARRAAARRGGWGVPLCWLYSRASSSRRYRPWLLRTREQGWLAPHPGGNLASRHVQHRDRPTSRPCSARGGRKLEAGRDKPRELEAEHGNSKPSGAADQNDAAA